jgi:heme-degrading monooxygenase HmoA
MYARVTVVDGDPERIEAGAKLYKEQVLPAIQGVPGYKGSMLLANRTTGKGIGMSWWETEEARSAGATAVDEARKATIQEMGGSVPPVDEYEVMISDIR